MIEIAYGKHSTCYKQVSFVDSIATIKGVTHVQYVTDQIVNHVMGLVSKNAGVNHIFLNSLIDNPAFHSQTKETLTTRQSSFGSKRELSQDFMKKVAKCGMVENILSPADLKQSKELKTNDGTKRQRLAGLTKLDDANDARGRYSEDCILILTVGDSAKALAGHDGSHIKGLLVNFIHSFWPSLPSFLVEYITPVVKATLKNGKALSFYTILEYEAWKDSLDKHTRGWSIKYYKLFKNNMSSKSDPIVTTCKAKANENWTKVTFKPDLAKFRMAIMSKRVLDLVGCLGKVELNGQGLPIKTFQDYVGLYLGTVNSRRQEPLSRVYKRKILFSSFEVTQAKVAQFSSLVSTIIGMAQNYVAITSISRARSQGGKDYASGRYIFTCLSPIRRFKNITSYLIILKKTVNPSGWPL